MSICASKIIIENFLIKEAMQLITMSCYACDLLRADVNDRWYNYSFGTSIVKHQKVGKSSPQITLTERNKNTLVLVIVTSEDTFRICDGNVKSLSILSHSKYSHFFAIWGGWKLLSCENCNNSIIKANCLFWDG